MCQQLHITPHNIMLQVFQEMCQQLHITPHNAQITFITIVNELFSDGIKWGRVVALLAFSGALSVQCVEKEMPLLVDQVAEWTVSYIDTQLASWIQENGGWVRQHSTSFHLTTTDVIFSYINNWTALCPLLSCKFRSEITFLRSSVMERG